MGSYADNATVIVDGRKGRVICASNRAEVQAAMAVSSVSAEPISDGEDSFGTFQRFAPRKGDLSAEEAARYKGREWAAPKRAFLTIEGEGKTNRWNRRITHHFGLVVEGGAPLVVGGHVVIAQENQGPPAGTDWRPPAMEFGAVSVVRPRSQVRDEFLELKGHVWDDALDKAVDVGTIRSKLPMLRDGYYGVALAYADGRGGPGLLEFWLGIGAKGGMQLQGRYEGPLGYADFGGPYPAYGAYLHPGQVDVAVRIYGWREAPKLAA